MGIGNLREGEEKRMFTLLKLPALPLVGGCIMSTYTLNELNRVIFYTNERLLVAGLSWNVT